MSPRRKSMDSSDSSDSSSSHDKKSKDKKDKKNKKKDKKDKDHKHGSSSHAPSAMPQFPPSHASGYGQQPHIAAVPQPGFSGEHHHQETFRAVGEFTSPPPAYSGSPQPPPPSGFRVPLATTSPFPDLQQTGQPPFYDADGVSPIFLGSALLERSVHPCKIGPHLQPFASVPYGGGEYGHNGRFDLLPFRPEQMEFVLTSYGRIPPGRRPIEGGYEEHGGKLYHAVAAVQGVRVPGKCGEHLGGCRVAFGGVEYSIDDKYEVLCWR